MADTPATSALKSFDATMKALGLEQLDMFLIHWPVPSQGKYVEAWKTLVELQQQGRIKSIGVSQLQPGPSRADHQGDRA